jgi:hypothetical protein
MICFGIAGRRPIYDIRENGNMTDRRLQSLRCGYGAANRER